MLRLRLAAWAVAAVLACAVARFWHPAYGFTSFLQFDSTDAPAAVPGMQGSPVYIYPGEDGYDGFSYAEVAYDPLIRHPDALKRALSNVPYRARRILGSALAWLLAAGRPLLIAKAYAALNLAVWPLFAWLAWRLIGVKDLRAWLLWFGLVCGAGALHSVRLALTDLLGVSCFAAAMLAMERGKQKSSFAWLALGGLARETILADLVALGWNARSLARSDVAGLRGRSAREGPRAPPATAVIVWITGCVLAAVPLCLWVLYVRLRAGPALQGLGNFTWPVVGWWEKWGASLGAFRRQPQFFWVDLATLLSLAGLTAQAAYVLRWPRLGDPWWRAGAAGVLLMAGFGAAVWEGNPGAALRVLLPLGLAFAVLAARDRAGAGWIAAGNLSVLSGVLAFANPPHDPKELGAGHAAGCVYVIRAADGWYGAERLKSKVWAWTPGAGTLGLREWGAASRPLRLQLGLRSASPRIAEIRVGARLAWSGEIGTQLKRIDVGPLSDGDTSIVVRTPVPPVREPATLGNRDLGIAVYNPVLVAP